MMSFSHPVTSILMGFVADLWSRLCKLSGWLTVLPMSQDHFDLTTQEFYKTLALDYQRPFLSISSSCDVCNAPFSIDHAVL